MPVFANVSDYQKLSHASVGLCATKAYRSRAAVAGGGGHLAKHAGVRLTAGQTCADQFSCAYSNRILRQGHIYIMLGYICFHSTVAATVLAIKTSTIQSISPKSNLLFPNSIEIIEACMTLTAT